MATATSGGSSPFGKIKFKVSTRYVPGENLDRTLKYDPELLEFIARQAEHFAEEVRHRAPRDTGLGAESIEARPSRSQGAFDVGWDKEHWYLIFPEFGTKYQPEQRFMREVLDEFRIE